MITMTTDVQFLPNFGTLKCIMGEMAARDIVKVDKLRIVRTYPEIDGKGDAIARNKLGRILEVLAILVVVIINLRLRNN